MYFPPIEEYMDNKNSDWIKDLIQQNTRLKRMNQNLNMNLGKFRSRAHTMESLISSVPQSIWVIDDTGTIIFVNDSFFEEATKYIEVQSHSIVGKNFYDFMYQLGLSRYEIDTIRKYDAELFAQPKEMTHEQKMTLIGRTCVYYTHKKIIVDSLYQQPVLMGMAVDITDLKQHEALLKASVHMVEKVHLEKIRFLENIRHDLQSPLSNIVAAADLIKKMLADEGAQEFLEAIISSVNHVMELFAQLIDFFQTKNQKQPNRIQPIVFQQLVSDVSNSIKIYVHNRPITFEVDIHSSVPSVILTDRVKISRILNNLLSNAFKYTHEGSVRLIINFDEHAEQLWVEVSDSGIGISSEDMERIFEPLVRLQHPGNGDYEGLGLGLSIVDQFVRELNGRIQVSSELGIGSVFRLCIPASCVRDKAQITC